MLGLLLSQAFALYTRGQLQSAENICREVLKGHPSNFDATHLAGMLRMEQGDFEGSVRFLENAAKLAPLNAPARLHLGDALRRLRRHDEAIASYQRALKLEPDFVEALNNLGNALRETGCHEDAVANLRRARSLRPDDAEIENNLGNALRDQGRAQEALASYDRSIALNPQYAEAHNNRGFLLTALRRTDEALESYEHAQTIYPGYARAHLNEGLCRLLIGDYARGWPKYEWRWADVQRKTMGTYKQPKWNGESSLVSKTIFVPAEQGFGDCIQFVRYLPELVARGARVAAGAPKELVRLLSSLPDIEVTSAHPTAFDYYCPLASLPGVLFPAAPPLSLSPYLQAPEERIQYWHQRLGTPKSKRIGIVWRASATDPLRSVPPKELLNALSGPWTLYCVQKDVSALEQQVLAENPNVMALGQDFSDFADTAAVLTLMDFVVSVDTSVAHLAGSLGIPALVLLHTASDWRFGISGERSPWYPSMRLFRQKAAGDWRSPLQAVRRWILASR